MKSSKCFLIFLCLTVSQLCFPTNYQKCHDNNEEPEFANFLSFDSLSCDFGTHKIEEGTLEHRFKFKNMSNEAILIDEIITGCPCLKTQNTKRLIAPNDTSSILVKYNPAGKKAGEYKKIIYIPINQGNYYVLLELQGNTL